MLLPYDVVTDQVSKDVRKIRDFEQQLVSNYGHYLALLEDTLRGRAVKECGLVLVSSTLKLFLLVGLLEQRVSVGKKRKNIDRTSLKLADGHTLSQCQLQVRVPRQ